MNITNESICNALIELGLNVRKTGEVTPDKQFDYLLVSVTELPPLENKPIVSMNDDY